MDCGTSLIKYLLFVFNTLVSVAGILGIIYGVLMLDSLGLIKNHATQDLPPQALFPMVLITICSIVVFISFLGCCGAIRESVAMTMSYAVLLLIILIIQLVVIVFLYINKEQMVEGIDEFVELAWRDDSGFFDNLQRTFQCCGKSGFIDYPTNLRLIPSSCCPSEVCLGPNSYPGCATKIKQFISGNIEYAKNYGIGLVAFELVGFVFGCSLANAIRNTKRRHRVY